jgi:hypothetical protein
VEETRIVHQAVVTRILQGDGRASPVQRRAAFDNAVLAEQLDRLIGRVAEQPTQVSDDDFTAAKESGLTEDQIFELVVCAAVGEATRQYHSALGALAAVMTDRRP